MTKQLQAHAAQRIDKDDYLHGAAEFPQQLVNLRQERLIQDNQARIARGFRVELADQTIYPGRVIVHAGLALDTDGQELLNEDQFDVSRTITLEGVSTTFYLEIEFTDADSDSDARAFWDPTVDQGNDPSGDPKPDGQEFGNTVATRRTSDWKIVTPVATSGFERDTNPNSTKVPLMQLTTDVANAITSGTAADPATVVLEIVQTTPGIIRVQDPTFFGTGDVDLGVGLATSETLTIASVDYDAGLVTMTGNIINVHNPGEIVARNDAGAPQLFVEQNTPRYQRTGSEYDQRDFLFRGDEVHGEILMSDHAGGSPVPRSNVNLQTLKDHIDFLAAKLQEMQWGVPDPTVSLTSATRTPPGLSTAFPTTPRHYDAAGGIQGARAIDVTVGDGVSSWGDFTGATQTSIQAAIDSLPSGGGRVVIKGGNYSLTGNVTVTTDNVHIVGLPTTVIRCNGGGFVFQVTGRMAIEGLSFTYLSTTVGVDINTSAPSRVEIKNCDFIDTTLDIDVALPDDTFVQECEFSTVTRNQTLVQTTAAGGVIKGTWEKCTFTNVTGTALAGSCIDTSGATTGLVDASFVDCLFNSTLANTATIDCGSLSSVVKFTRCKFSAAAALTSGHIWFDNGENLSVVNCVHADALSRLVDANGSVRIAVDGAVQPSGLGTLYNVVRCVDCADVSIRNCKIYAGGATALTESPFRFETQAITLMAGISLINNTVEAGNNNCTGVIFDCSAGTGDMKDIQIVDNNFKNTEVGVYFAATVGARQYYGIHVEGNNFNDRDASVTQASYQKLGIIAGANAQLYHASFIGNKFINMNPGNSTTVGGRTRAAIDLQSSTNEDITISNNHVVNVGDSANPNANVAAFRCAALDRALIVDNIIDSVDGEDANGIILSEGTNVATEIVCKGNTLKDIVTGAAGAEVWGITAYGMQKSTFAGNVFRDLSMGGAKVNEFGCIGHHNNAGVFSDIAVVGNTATGSDADVNFVSAYNVGGVERVSVSGNTVTGSFDRGVELRCWTGTALAQVSVANNSFNGTTYGVSIANNGTGGSQFSITGNAINHGSGAGIRVSDCSLFSITGNTIYTTTAATDNITLLDAYRFVIASNITRVAGTGTYNITMGGTDNGIYLIHSNVCDQNGAASTVNINNDATGASGGIIANNLVDRNLGAIGNGTAGYNAAATVMGIDTMAATNAAGVGAVGY